MRIPPLAGRKYNKNKKLIITKNPFSINKLFNISDQDSSSLLTLSEVSVLISKLNYAHSTSLIWNELIKKVFDKFELNEKDDIVPGSSWCSDIASPYFSHKKE